MTEEAPSKPPLKKWLPWLATAVVLVAAYFINVEVQTRLGEKALAETGLASLSLQNALVQAKQQGKKVLVDVSAIWCPTCRKLDKAIFSNSEVKNVLEQNYVFSRIEYESEEAEAFMDKYDVKGFPTLVVLDANGSKIKKLELTFDPGGFISQL